MAKEKFSLVAPLYKTEAFLKTFLDSVVSQDYGVWELFVVADGPSPEGKTIIEAYQDPRITYVEKEHSGVCATRNLGKSLATGTYIAFPSTDFKLHPGCFRTWLLAFQDHPDADFVYGGYRLMQNGKDMFDFPSDPFDEDQLFTRNYIDGGFPIKREKCPEWDVNCKSLNDWEFWIQVVKAGCVGYYMAHEGRPTITFAAEVPRHEGLSEDSHNHWLERVDYIKQKHGIPNRPVNCWSFGAPFHGRRTARLMGADFSMPSEKPHRYEVLYLLGWYGEHFKANVGYFKDPLKNAPAACKKVVHWIGSDVQFLAERKMIELREIRGLLEHLGVVHVTECQWMHDELAEYGIESKIIPLPLSSEIEMTDLPEQFTVGIYMPHTGGSQKYHQELMHAIMRSLQDIPFVFFGTPDAGKKGNEEHLSHVPIQHAINRCTINLRVTHHDGLPITPIEFLMGGREVITSVPVAHAHYITGGEYASVREAIVAKIRDIQKHPRSLEARAAARNYWMEETAVWNFKKRFYEAAGWSPEGQPKPPKLALVKEAVAV